MEQEIIILSVGKPYSFIPDGGDKKIEGCKITYVTSCNLDVPFVNSDGILGYDVCKEAMPVDFYNKAMQQGIPSKAKAHFGLRVRNGSQALVLDGLDFIKK